MAENGAYVSKSSLVATLKFDGDAVIDAVEGLVVDHKDNSSVTLSWKAVKGADGYYVIHKGGPYYPLLPKNSTKQPKITGT